MADSINPAPYGLTTPDMNEQVLQGFKNQAAIGGLRALQGVDLNNPDSMNNALQGSIRAGAIDQATALQNLAFTRYKVEALQKLPQQIASAQAYLMGGGEQPQQSQQPQQPSPEANPKLADFHADAVATAQKLLATNDPVEKQSIADDAAARYKAMGLPEDAIKADLGDLSVPHLEQVHDKHLAAYNASSGQAPAPQQNTYGATNAALNRSERARQFIAGGGVAPILMGSALSGVPELGQAFERAAQFGAAPAQAALTESATAPIKTAQAVAQAQGLLPTEVAKAGLVKQAELSGEQDVKGGTVYDRDDNPITLSGPEYRRWVNAPQAVKDKIGWSATEPTGAKAKATALGTAEGETVNVTTPSGATATVPKMSILRPGVGQANAVGPGIAQQQIIKKQASDYSSTIGAANAADRVGQIRQMQDLGRRIMAESAQGSGPLTSTYANILSPFAGAGRKISDYVNNAQLLDQDLALGKTDALKGVGASVVRNAAEYNQTTNAISSLNNQRDVIKGTGAKIKAIADLEDAFTRFTQDYNRNPSTDKTPDGLIHAWQQTEAYKRGIAGSKVWENVTLGTMPDGKTPAPALTAPVAHKDGHKYVVWGQGLPKGNQIVIRVD